MKPKNAREREALRLSKDLLYLTKAQAKWVRESVVGKRIFTAGLTCWCTDCGHSWKERIAEGAETARCPHCGRVGTVSRSRHTTCENFAYAKFIQTYKGWQVIRYYVIEWECRKGEEVKVYDRHIFQKWCQPGRPPITIGVPLGNMMGYFRIPYSSWGGPMSVKSAKREGYYYEWMETKTYPRMTLLPVYKRVLGTRPDFSVFAADTLLGDIFGCPYLESLYKAKQVGKIKQLLPYSELFHKYWPSVKVAVRHGYEPEHWISYFDYLKMLRFLHYDVRSPRYVAPPDWDEIHERVMTQYGNRLAKMRRKKEEAEALRRAQWEEEQARKNKNAKRSFHRRIAKFAALCITDESLVIKPLLTIKEFAEEGNAMHHCVFSNAYYNKPQSLILSARKADTGERLETIEVDLKGLTIWQSRGGCNHITSYHDQIQQLVNEAMPQIDALAHPRKKAVVPVRS